MAPETDQRRRLKRLEDQERKLVFPDFSLSDAWTLGSMLAGIAAERALPVAIRIELGEQTAFHVGMPGATAENDDWLRRKGAVVRRFGVSTYILRVRGELSGRDYAELDPARFAVAGGCVPIRTPAGTLLGTVGVSGLSQADDHALVVDAMAQFLADAKTSSARTASRR
jgi:uncharacterized protein (UPF0303 family)